MADIKVSALPAASALDGTEKLPVVQGAASKAATTEQVRALVQAKNTFAADFGDASSLSFTFTHNLGTRDVHVMVRNNAAPYGFVLVDYAATSTNTVTVSGFATAPASNALRAIIKA